MSPVNILPTRLVAMALNATNFTANTTGGEWNGSDPGSDTFAEDHGSEVDVLIKVVLTSLSCIVFFYVCWRNSRMHWLDGEDLVEEGIEGEQEDPEARLKRYQQQLACHSVVSATNGKNREKNRVSSTFFSPPCRFWKSHTLSKHPVVKSAVQHRGECWLG